MRFAWWLRPPKVIRSGNTSFFYVKRAFRAQNTVRDAACVRPTQNRQGSNTTADPWYKKCQNGGPHNRLLDLRAPTEQEANFGNCAWSQQLLLPS
eukprot:GDKH01001358.1.p2 GENE.GDKH01001358.1~~GDKH01001358.1.p2  ORF type:complete len:95 (-),score=1.63 GDKH01001358.1:83-367(-)